MRAIRDLRADEVELKVKKVTEKGVVLVPYKTARVDMDILDETFGAENWTNDYKEIRGVLYCGIGIKDFSEGATGYIWKWDCGIESREDGGNEKKGEASDAFKRAGVRWGIGRELYTAPFIFVAVPTEKPNGAKNFQLKNPFEKFYVSDFVCINKTISKMCIVNSSGKKVFDYLQETQSVPKSEKKLICPSCGEEITSIKSKGKEQSPEYVLKVLGKCYKCYKREKVNGKPD